MSGSRGDTARCAETAPLLHALADGELDAANALRCEAHLGGCDRCATEFADILATREALRREGVRHRAPERLRSRVLASLEAVAPGPAFAAAAPEPPQWPRRPLAVAAAATNAAAAPPRRPPWKRGKLPALALAASVAAALFVAAPPLPRPEGGGDAEVRREVVAGHVRSLLAAGHLTDVPSSDRHTVKPWFAGRIGFSPPVPDLADAGFPLTGGRLDYLDGRAVAALVYRRHDHVINVFVWLEPAAAATPAAAPRRGDGGHAVLHWTDGGMAFWAVSDLDAGELADFARQFRARAQTAEPQR